jgi:hypothetical protein
MATPPDVIIILHQGVFCHCLFLMDLFKNSMGFFIFRKIFAVPIKTSSLIPNSVKGYSSSGRGSILMPPTTGIAKSGAILEPYGEESIKNGANLAPQSS